MQNVNNTIVDWLLGAIAPHLCSSCGRPGRLLCLECKLYNKPVTMQACWVCGKGKAQPLCDKCGESVDHIGIVGLRTGGLRLLLDGLKFHYKRAAAAEVALLLADVVRESQRPTVIVPVPTSAAHIRQRGYDHMRLVAHSLSRRLGYPVQPVLISSARHTQHQLGRQARYQAMEHAFGVVTSLSPETRYLLIDDIVTTGATLLRAVACVRQAGAQYVEVAVVARQPSTNTTSSVKMGKITRRGDRVV